MQQRNTPHKSETPTVLVDHREREPRIVNALKSHGAEVTIGRLTVGDYHIDNRLVVERKTIRDLALSVMNGRLFHQARTLANPSSERVCLVIEGRHHGGHTGGLSRAGLHGTLVSLTLVFGIPVLLSRSPEETASLMLLAAEQLRRRFSEPPRRYGRKTHSIRRTQLLMLQSIPKVGPLRSEALLAAFKSPAMIAAATNKEIAAVQGIGPTTAKRITTVMHGRPEKNDSDSRSESERKLHRLEISATVRG